METKLNVVTGGLSYTGKYITEQLLKKGEVVKTLTGHPNRPNPFGGQIKVVPLNFDRYDELVINLRGASTLYITYWIRFSHGDNTYERAVQNSQTLIKAAEEANVSKFVYISIANASENSSLPYFKSKGFLESCFINSSIPSVIIRPTLVFGVEDILINNIAWLLRKFPLFGLPGTGDYQVQPIFVEDLAKLAVEHSKSQNNIILDAAGPVIYTFGQFVRLIAEVIGSNTKIINMKPGLAHFFSKIVGYFVKDVILTHDEVIGLMDNLLISKTPPRGETDFHQWLSENKEEIGISYTSELARHY